MSEENFLSAGRLEETPPMRKKGDGKDLSLKICDVGQRLRDPDREAVFATEKERTTSYREVWCMKIFPADIS